LSNQKEVVVDVSGYNAFADYEVAEGKVTQVTAEANQVADVVFVPKRPCNNN